MAKIGRNSQCPCGSGKKYKQCCQQKEIAMRQTKLPPGQFRYESGSYGSPNRGYMPSILCYKQVGGNSWKEHFCLVNYDEIHNDENEAVAIAEQHIASAYNLKANGGSIQDFALYLRHEGYKKVDDFQVIKN